MQHNNLLISNNQSLKIEFTHSLNIETKKIFKYQKIDMGNN